MSLGNLWDYMPPDHLTVKSLHDNLAVNLEIGWLGV